MLPLLFVNERLEHVSDTPQTSSTHFHYYKEQMYQWFNQHLGTNTQLLDR